MLKSGQPGLPILAAEFRRLFRIMPHARRRQFGWVLFLMIAAAAAELAMIAAVVPFLKLLAGGATGESPITAAGTFAAIAFLTGVLRLKLAWSTQNFTTGLGHDFSVEIQRRTLAQPYSYHIGRNSSELIASLEKMQVIVSSVLLHLMQAVSGAVIGLFILAAIVRIDAAAAIAAAVALAALYALVAVATRTSLRRNSEVVGDAYQRRVQLIQESLGGIRDILIDQTQSAHVEEFRRVDERLARARVRTGFVAVAPRFVIEAFGLVLIAGLAVLVAGRGGGLTAALPIIGALALGAQRLLPLVQQVYQAWSHFSGNRSLFTQALDLLELPVGEQPDASARPLPLRRAIRLDQATLTYPGRRRPAIAEVSLDIPAGSRVALVGPTGSGKSTLADLVMGLLPPDSGRILIDGQELTDATRASWQRSVAHVPQSVFLADASIARNVALGAAPGEIDGERVERASRAAQLHEFVSSLPEGYSTRVGERGIRLSGGQRQRIGIARAIYKDAPVLVLDEPTSALDPKTERAVLTILDQLSAEGRTIIIISHRGGALERCDYVVRLESGRVVEVAARSADLERQYNATS